MCIEKSIAYIDKINKEIKEKNNQDNGMRPMVT